MKLLNYQVKIMQYLIHQIKSHIKQNNLISQIFLPIHLNPRNLFYYRFLIIVGLWPIFLNVLDH
jgi:hypothetical protein